jgi:hypothetical protein
MWLRRVWLPTELHGGFVTPDYEVAQQQNSSTATIKQQHNYKILLSLSLLDALAPRVCPCKWTEFEYPVQEPSSLAILVQATIKL